MEPQRMIEAGNLHVTLPHRFAVGQQRSGQQAEVRGVGQHVFVQGRDIGQVAVRAKPGVLHRVARLGVERVALGDRADLDRLGAQHLVANSLGQLVGHGPGQLYFSGQVFRADHLGHLRLVLEPFLVVLERGAAGEDRLALLNRRHPPGAEAAAIAHAVHRIHHRQAGIARAQEVAMQRMHMACILDRLAGRRQ